MGGKGRGQVSVEIVDIPFVTIQRDSDKTIQKAGCQLEGSKRL